jgi:8-oxo-dGTP pyrophosphatase MutT (NUDIX family)
MLKVISLLENELKKELPGKIAHDMLMPEGRMVTSFERKTNHASILILIYPDIEDREKIVFIKRPLYDGHHSGQVGFPGGKFELSDKSYKMTALRESKEEIGINTSAVKIIGNLSDLYIAVSNFLVHPYVGYTENTPTFILDKNEVDYIVEFPFNDLIDLEIKMKQDFQTDRNRKIPYFEINKEVVWGATSMILNEFILVLRKINQNYIF